MDKSSSTKLFDELERKLREAALQRDIDKRSAAICALEAVLEFIYKVRPGWASDQLHRPLADLLAGLNDLDKGRRVPFLSPTSFPNRHQENFLLQMSRGCAIFAVERLIIMGRSAASASKEVATIWNKYTGETKAAGTIKSWYDRRDKVRNKDPAFDVLAQLRTLCDTENLDQPSKEAVRNALAAAGLNDDLNDYLPTTERDVLNLLARVLSTLKPRQ